jgi:putative CocE/NonD family hydrolase
MVFETGANRWQSMPNWPPGGLAEKSLYLETGGGLSWNPPSASAPGYREYVSDPANPVPYTSATRHWYDPAFMAEDQRFAAARPDVLVYRSGPLESAVTVAGPLTASLFVSTSGTDSDWIVKMIDVFPEDTPDPSPDPGNARLAGYQMLVRGDVMRGKFRKSFSAPEAFVPGEVAEVEFVMQDIFHTFLPGHRIMIQIQSSWFPMIDRNPQKFVDIYHAQAGDFQKATQRIYSSAQYPSRLTFGAMR